MAKITRKNQLIFGSDAGSQGIVEYGSPASGTPVASTDPDDIQTAAWETGWAAAALAGTEIPTFQDFNAIHFVSTRQIAYLLQEGIPEFSLETEYYQNSIVKKTGTYELYGSKTDANIGNALPSAVDDTYWQYLGDLSDLVDIPNISDAFSTKLMHVQDQKSSGTSGGTFTSGAWQTRTLNTVLTNEISGASLSSNQVTLPAGTYYIEGKGACVNPSLNMIRLYNVTDGAVLLSGESHISTSTAVSSYPCVSGRFTIASTKTIRLEHRSESTSSTVGFGSAVGASFTVSHEMYADLKLWKVA